MGMTFFFAKRRMRYFYRASAPSARLLMGGVWGAGMRRSWAMGGRLVKPGSRLSASRRRGLKEWRRLSALATRSRVRRAARNCGELWGIVGGAFGVHLVVVLQISICKVDGKVMYVMSPAYGMVGWVGFGLAMVKIKDPCLAH